MPLAGLPKPVQPEVQPAQRLDFVAQRCRAFELRCRGCRRHLSLETNESTPILALQKPPGFVHALPIGRTRAGGGARSEARADLVAQTSSRANDGEQLALLGENHRLASGAIAELEQIVQSSHRLGDAAGGIQRTEREEA